MEPANAGRARAGRVNGRISRERRHFPDRDATMRWAPRGTRLKQRDAPRDRIDPDLSSQAATAVASSLSWVFTRSWKPVLLAIVVGSKMTVMDALARFLLGGLMISLFAMAGDLLKPRTFAGLLGAAPSLALASLGLAIGRRGHDYATTECRFMIAGAIALAAHSALMSLLLMRYHWSPMPATLGAAAAWFVVAFGLWIIFSG
jgi:hypothetical protein